MNQECIFCKIVTGEIPSDQVLQDDQVVAFHDINPVAPTHILIVPKLHISSVNDLNAENESLVGHMIVVASKLAKEQGVAQDGYRLIINTGQHAGQVVFHLHLHLIGGQKMRYPMG